MRVYAHGHIIEDDETHIQDEFLRQDANLKTVFPKIHARIHSERTYHAWDCEHRIAYNRRVKELIGV